MALGTKAATLIIKSKGWWINAYVVGVQPAHHGLRASSSAFSNRRGTTAFGDLVQCQEAFAAARMGGAQGQMAQIRNRLVPALMINS